MNPIQSDLVKEIEFISLTEQEEKEAIFEGKKKKYFHEKNGAEFKRRYPEYENCPKCGFPIDNRFHHSCRD